MKVSDALLRRVGRAIDPGACWDSEPINEYQAEQLRRAQDKAREVLAVVSFASGDLTPDDVRRLVIAARHVAFDSPIPTVMALKDLDTASEAFADRIPWEDDPAQEQS